MTKLAVKYKKTTDLIPYAMNSRTHDEGQLAQIASSIKAFGFNNPIAIDGDNGIIAGHGRLMAAHKLGMQEVPTIELGHLTEGQKRAYVIADNKIALNAGWDAEMLKFELQAMSAEELGLTGFSESELEGWLGDDDKTTDGDGVDFETSYEIIVECISEAEQAKVLEELTQKGLKCKSLLR